MNAFPVRKILLVDDDTALRAVLTLVLRDEGFAVHCAVDGREALAAMREHLFDLVITDMVMPGKEGIETILDLRAMEPGIRIIAMSGAVAGSAGNFLPLAKTLGAAAVLQKPFERDALMAAIDEVLGRPLLPRMAC